MHFESWAKAVVHALSLCLQRSRRNIVELRLRERELTSKTKRSFGSFPITDIVRKASRDRQREGESQIGQAVSF